MSVKERKLKQISRAIHRAQEKETSLVSGPQRFGLRIKRWVLMLYFEIQKNDVAIRAESLSYFTLFSIMPLMAGIFLLLGFFSQWGPIQKEFEELLSSALQAIPEEQRDTLLDFILQFKDQYLAKLSAKSSSIGIFAIGILIWIGAKVFFNIESLMNRIWAVKENRPLFDRIQNFVFCVVLLPLIYAMAISLPKIIEHFGQKKVGLLLDQGLPFLIGFFSLSFVFKFFPNTKVSWKSAHAGALASSLGFLLGNFFLRFYFRMGTETAYGKAAALPIFAFFIYVSWLIFILGVEVSLLTQAEGRVNGKPVPQTTLASALILERVLQQLQDAFQKGVGPLTAAELSKELDVNQIWVEQVLDFLVKRGAVIQAQSRFEREDCFSLAKAIEKKDLLKLIKDHLDLGTLAQNFDVKGLISTLSQD